MVDSCGKVDGSFVALWDFLIGCKIGINIYYFVLSIEDSTK